VYAARPLSSALVALALFLAACPSPSTDSAKASSAAAPADCSNDSGLAPDTVVATFLDKKMTLAELDAEFEATLNERRISFRDEMHEMRSQLLERHVLQQVLKAEAAKQGHPDDEAYVTAMVVIPTDAEGVTDAEVSAFYEENKDRMQGAPLELVAERIKMALLQERKAKRFGELVERLKAEYKVSIDLPAPRFEVEAIGPSKGPESAKITIVEFSDFECPYCGRATAAVDEVLKTYGDKVRLVFRHYPLDFHKKAKKAAEASACAADQGKFWELHDRLFEYQTSLEVAQLKEHAAAIGLDAAKFDACLDGGAKAEIVERDLKAGRQLGVSGTPAFFINGVKLAGAQPFEAFKRVIDKELGIEPAAPAAQPTAEN